MQGSQFFQTPHYFTLFRFTAKLLLGGKIGEIWILLMNSTMLRDKYVTLL